jgi:hypothetical protein
MASMAEPGGSLKSGGRFYASVSTRYLDSVITKVFSVLICCMKRIYNFCTFKAIWENNVAIH